jgi:hypothetical protein
MRVELMEDQKSAASGSRGLGLKTAMTAAMVAACWFGASPQSSWAGARTTPGVLRQPQVGEVVHPASSDELSGRPPLAFETDRSDCTITASVTTRIHQEKSVTMETLLRTRPDIIVDMAREIRAGRLPADALAGLHSESLARSLVSADLPQSDDRSPRDSISEVRDPVGQTRACEETVPPPTEHGTSLKRMQSTLADEPADDPHAAVQIAATASMLGQMIAMDVSPGQLDLGSVLVGERRRATFHVTTMTAGVLTVRPVRGSLVRVIAISPRVTGLRLRDVAGPRGSGPQAIGGLRDRSVNRGVDLDVGQSADVVVEFRPRAEDGFDGAATPYQTSLNIAVTQPGLAVRRMGEGDARDNVELAAPGTDSQPNAAVNRTVRLNAVVAGKMYGIGITMDQGRLYADPGEQFNLTFDWYNVGIAGDATVAIDPSGLPAGVTLASPASISIHLEAGEEKRYDYFLLNGPPAETSGSGGKDGVLSLTLTQASAQGVQTTRLKLPVYAYTKVGSYSCYELVEIPGKATVQYKCSIYETSTGYYNMIAHVSNVATWDEHPYCWKFSDHTTFKIAPFSINSKAKEFGPRDTIGAMYWMRGYSGELSNDYDTYAGKMTMSHTVTCYHQFQDF